MRPQIENPWSYLWRWIALAGGLFPVVSVALTSLSLLVLSPASSEGFVGLLAFPMFVCFAFVAGVVYASLVAMPIFALVRVAIHFLDWRPAWRERGIFCGGLVAHVCLLPIYWDLFADPLNEFRFGWEWDALLGVANFLLAVFLGQTCGALAGMKIQSDWYDSTPPPKSEVRFSLHQLLAATVVVSLLLTALQFLNLLGAPMALATTSWLCAYLMLRPPAIFFAERWRDRHSKKQSQRAEAQGEEGLNASGGTRNDSV